MQFGPTSPSHASRAWPAAPILHPALGMDAVLGSTSFLCTAHTLSQLPTFHTAAPAHSTQSKRHLPKPSQSKNTNSTPQNAAQRSWSRVSLNAASCVYLLVQHYLSQKEEMVWRQFFFFSLFFFSPLPDEQSVN